MKLHPAPISAKLRNRPPILCQYRASSPFPGPTINRLAEPPYPTLLRFDGKVTISSSLAHSVRDVSGASQVRFTQHYPRTTAGQILPSKHQIIDTNRSRPVFVRSDQVRDEAPDLDDSIFERTVRFVYAVWRLLRPFVLYETVIAAFAWFARASLQKPTGQAMGLSILQVVSALFVMACCVGSISGLNQIYDREIDEINKPFLPISSGDLSVPTAWTLVFSMTVSGFMVAIANRAQPLIMTLYSLYIIIVGVLYSVPPLRWKRFAFGTHFVIASHGAILNIGLYHALKNTVSFPLRWTVHMTVITTFMTLRGIVNGLLKDLSDIEGDRKHNIMTPAVVFGPRKTTYMGVGILLLMYIFVMWMSILMPRDFRGTLMLPMHGLFSMFLVYRVRVLEKANYSKEACLKFYMAIWYLRYAEYIMFIFM